MINQPIVLVLVSLLHVLSFGESDVDIESLHRLLNELHITQEEEAQRITVYKCYSYVNDMHGFKAIVSNSYQYNRANRLLRSDKLLLTEVTNLFINIQFRLHDNIV